MKMIDRENLIQTLQSQDNGTGVFTRKAIIEAAASIGLGFPAWLINGKPEVKVERGIYNLTTMFGGQVAQAVPLAVVQTNQATVAPAPAILTQAILNVTVDNLIPNKDETFVPFGFYKDLKTVLSTSMFYPIFISGLSGNGKTLMVEELHSKFKKELIRVNVTIETDEDDLLGGYRLKDGQTVWQNGPLSKQ